MPIDAHRDSRTFWRRTASVVATTGLAVAPAGCGLLSGGESNLTFDARTTSSVLQPAYTSAVYRSIDENTLDVYLTDLPMDRLIDAAEGRLSEPLPPGNITRVHLFLNPRAGYTPIDYTAANASITHIVVSGEVYGVYTGAGFVLPSTTPGDSTFSGKTNGANLRLSATTPGFEDRLGPSELTGRINAVRDDAKAETIGGLVSAMARWAGAGVGAEADR
ncbi:MAG: hypothetical protein ACKVZJ_07730 [Phycisphaerales bacterium]